MISIVTQLFWMQLITIAGQENSPNTLALLSAPRKYFYVDHPAKLQISFELPPHPVVKREFCDFCTKKINISNSIIISATKFNLCNYKINSGSTSAKKTVQTLCKATKKTNKTDYWNSYSYYWYHNSRRFGGWRCSFSNC